MHFSKIIQLDRLRGVDDRGVLAAAGFDLFVGPVDEGAGFFVLGLRGVARERFVGLVVDFRGGGGGGGGVGGGGGGHFLGGGRVVVEEGGGARW